MSPGTANVFRYNDVHNSPGGVADVSAVSLHANVVAKPLFGTRLGHDYRVLRIGSSATLKIDTSLG